MPQLRARADKGDTEYNLRNCAYMEEFEKQQIAWIELTDSPKFTLIKNMFSLNTVFFMTGDHLEHIIAQLNSTLITWYFTNCIASSSGVGTTRWLKFTIEQLPLMPYTDDTLGTLVGNSSDHDIDKKVCEIFGLNETEKEYIESLKY